MTSAYATMTRSDLRWEGMSSRQITDAVAAGDLIRARRDRYLLPDTPRDIVRAVRVGGRLTCLSLLVMLEVFVHTNASLHVHLTRGSSRMRHPDRRRTRLRRPGRRVSRLRLHWWPLGGEAGASATVSVADALAHSVLCQTARNAVATFDSAVNKGLVTMVELADLRSTLPRKYAPIFALVDGRAQSGPETLVRLMARGIGCNVQLQVEFEGVGFVDLLLDGWLVVECDSEKFHGGWAQQKKDRDRDAALAALGHFTLRLTAETVLYRPEVALAAIRGLISAH